MKITAITAALVVSYVSADARFDCDKFNTECVVTRNAEAYSDCAASIAANTDESMSCRIEHLGLITEGNADDQARHCVHAMEVAEGPCADEQILEATEEGGDPVKTRELPCGWTEDDMAEFKLAVQEIGSTRSEGRFTADEIKVFLSTCDTTALDSYVRDEEKIEAVIREVEEKATVEDTMVIKEWTEEKIDEKLTESRTQRNAIRGLAADASDEDLKTAVAVTRDLTKEEIKILREEAGGARVTERVSAVGGCVQGHGGDKSTQEKWKDCQKTAADTDELETEIERLKEGFDAKTEEEKAVVKENVKKVERAKAEKEIKVVEELKRARGAQAVVLIEECVGGAKACYEQKKAEVQMIFAIEEEEFQVEVEKAKKEAAVRVLVTCEDGADDECKGTAELTLKSLGVSEDRVERVLEESKGELLKETIVACVEIAREEGGEEFDKGAAISACRTKGKEQFKKVGGEDAAVDAETEKKVNRIINKKAGEEAISKLDACIPAEGEDVTEEDVKDTRDNCLTIAKEAFEEAGGEQGKYLEAVEEGKRSKAVDWFCGCVEEEKIIAKEDSGEEESPDDGGRRLLQTDDELAKLEDEIISEDAKATCKGKAKEALAKLGISEDQFEDEKEEIEKRFDNSFEKSELVGKESKKRVRAIVKLEEVKDASVTEASEGKTRRTFEEIKTGLKEKVKAETDTKDEDVKPSAFIDEKEQVLVVKFTEKCAEGCDKTEVKAADKTKIADAIEDVEIVKEGKVYKAVVVEEAAAGRRLLQDDDTTVESTEDVTECTETSECDVEEEEETVPPTDPTEPTVNGEEDEEEEEDFSSAYTTSPAIFAAAVSMLFLTQS